MVNVVDVKSTSCSAAVIFDIVQNLLNGCVGRQVLEHEVIEIGSSVIFDVVDNDSAAGRVLLELIDALLEVAESVIEVPQGAADLLGGGRLGRRAAAASPAFSLCQGGLLLDLDALGRGNE